MQNDYDDIRFYYGNCNSINQTILNYELESYNSTQGIFWVKIPSFTSGTNNLCMYYGNSSITSQSNPSAVWNDDFDIVYHFNATKSEDSTSNNKNVVAIVGNPTSISNGFVGKGVQFSNNNALSLTDIDVLEDSIKEAAYEVYFTTSNDITTTQIIFGEGGGTNGMSIYISNGNLYTSWIDSDSVINFTNTPILANTKYHIISQYNYNSNSNFADISQVYLNGELKNSFPTTLEIGSHNGNAGIGYTNDQKRIHTGILNNAYFTGDISEFRAYNTFRDVDWINQSYQQVVNQNNLITFYNSTNPFNCSKKNDIENICFLNLTNLEDNKYNFEIFSIDTAGNQNQIKRSFTIGTDDGTDDGTNNGTNNGTNEFCDSTTEENGNGSSSNPYLICDKNSLSNVKNHLSSNFLVINDINLQGSETNKWDPINNFAGNFDGGGFLISNLYVNISGSYGGLFGITSSGSIIKNTGVKTLHIESNSDSGGLVGSSYSFISNSYVINTDSNISGLYNSGGLVGSSRSTISDSYVLNTDSIISSNSFNGGLVGSSFGSTILNSYVINNNLLISSNSDYSGGLIGYSSSLIEHSYVINMDSTTLMSSGYSGGLGGYTSSSYVISSAVSWLGTSNSLSGTNKGIILGNGKNTNSKYYEENPINGNPSKSNGYEFSSKPNFYTNNEQTSFIYDDWDFVNTWRFNTNDYPTLR